MTNVTQYCQSQTKRQPEAGYKFTTHHQCHAERSRSMIQLNVKRQNFFPISGCTTRARHLFNSWHTTRAFGTLLIVGTRPFYIVFSWQCVFQQQKRRNDTTGRQLPQQGKHRSVAPGKHCRLTYRMRLLFNHYSALSLVRKASG